MCGAYVHACACVRVYVRACVCACMCVRACGMGEEVAAKPVDSLEGWHGSTKRKSLNLQLNNG